MIDSFRGGYLKALIDVKDMFVGRDEQLSYRKILTKKSVKNITSVLDAMIAGRDDLMRFGSHGCDLFQRPDGTFLICEKNNGGNKDEKTVCFSCYCLYCLLRI